METAVESRMRGKLASLKICFRVEADQFDCNCSEITSCFAPLATDQGIAVRPWLVSAGRLHRDLGAGGGDLLLPLRAILLHDFAEAMFLLIEIGALGDVPLLPAR